MNNKIQIKQIYSLNNIKFIDYTYDSNTTIKDLLSQYPNYLCVYNNHIHGDCVDWIIKDGNVSWNVNAVECLISDYLNTYNKEEFVLNINEGGFGCSGPDLIETLKVIFEYLVFVADVVNVIQAFQCIYKVFPKNIKELISKIKAISFAKNLKDSNNEYISPDVLNNFIKTREQWDLDEFMDLCRIKNKKDAIRYLYSLGYIKNDKLFIYDKNIDESINNLILSYYNSQNNIDNIDYEDKDEKDGLG